MIQLDLADDAAVQVALDGLAVHGLVNVVGGVFARELFAPIQGEDAISIFERLMHFNTIPTLVAARAAARLMIARGQGASIVNIASGAGLISMPFGAGYAAGKAALTNLTRTMAVEWGCHGIRSAGHDRHLEDRPDPV